MFVLPHTVPPDCTFKTPCTQAKAEVCATNGMMFQTFSNICFFQQARCKEGHSWYVLHQGECVQTDKNVQCPSNITASALAGTCSPACTPSQDCDSAGWAVTATSQLCCQSGCANPSANAICLPGTPTSMSDGSILNSITCVSYCTEA